MTEEATKTNKQRFEALEHSVTELSTAMAEMARSQDITNQNINRLLTASKGKEPVGGRRTHGDDRRSRRSAKEVDDSSDAADNPYNSRFRRGGRVERGPMVVERWVHDDPIGGENNDDYESDGMSNGTDHGQRPVYEHRQGQRHGADDSDGDRRRGWGPRKPKIEFPHFKGGDPYEWLDKAAHYFRVFEVARDDRVAVACMYLDAKANSWWRWIKAQYVQDGRRLGWSAFEREFLIQWGPSPVVNHHGQLAKLKQDGKVADYVEEFRRLQILVRGWSEESLLGTFIEGLKPWIARELKLKQPQRLTEAMRMAEVLEGSYHNEKNRAKEDSGDTSVKTDPVEDSQAARVPNEGGSKKDDKKNQILSKEEVQERIKKGLCFKCGEKWDKGHRCRTGKVFLIDYSGAVDEDNISDGGELRLAEVEEDTCDAELSLDAMTGGSKPATMRFMAWIGTHVVSLLVDSGSTHNFISTDIMEKVGIESSVLEPFVVKVASGEKLKCEKIVRNAKINAQGVRITTDLHVLPMVGVDVVLGTTWLKSIGKVVTDYNTMTMDFKVDGRKRTWTALPPKEEHQHKAQEFKGPCTSGAQCFVMATNGDWREASWSDSIQLGEHYPKLSLEDKGVFEGRGNDENCQDIFYC